MGLKILLADDSSIVLDLLSNQIKALGHEVIGRESDSNAILAAYQKFNPDLLILDISFEGKNGLSVLREIRSFDSQANVLMVSANDQKEVLEAVSALGASLLAKPFTLDGLRVAVEAMEAKIRAKTAPTKRKFTTEDMELLSHILQEGSSIGSRRMSEFLGAKWKVSISGLRAISRDKVPSLFDQDAIPHTGAAIFIQEPIALGLVIFFPDWSLPPLMEALGRVSPSLKNQSNPQGMVVSETSNILGHGIMRALADRCGKAFIAAAPSVAHGKKAEILKALISRIPPAAEALFAQAEFYSDTQASSATVLLLADMAALFGIFPTPGMQQ